MGRAGCDCAGSHGERILRPHLRLGCLQWPRPAEEICRFIEEYHHDNRIGQGEDDAASKGAAIVSVHDDSFVLAWH